VERIRSLRCSRRYMLLYRMCILWILDTQFSNHCQCH
jgi:hypothetical protein